MSLEHQYLTLTEETFEKEVLASRQPVMVDFWAEWCGACRAIAPAVEELAVDFQGRARVAKVNVDEHRDLALRFGIRSIPAILFFRGGEVADRVVGVVPKHVLAAKIDALVP